MSFSVNGKDMGIAYHDESIKTIPLHFAVGLWSEGDEVEIMN